MIYAGESKLEKTHSTDIWGRKSLSQTLQDNYHTVAPLTVILTEQIIPNIFQ